MVNKIIYMDKDSKQLCEQIMAQSNLNLVRINGTDVQTKSDFFQLIEKELHFPGSCNNKFSAFDDWITDLSWYPQESGFCICIEQSDTFLREDEHFRKLLLSDFQEDILPFWEKDVLKYVKDGKPREFYLIICDGWINPS